MKRLFVGCMLLASSARAADPHAPEWSSSVTLGAVVIANSEQASSITFGGSGISVNTVTGEVKIPNGLKLDDASRQFWEAVGSLAGHKPNCVENKNQ